MQDTEIKCNRIGKEEAKLSICTIDKIIYAANSVKSAKKAPSANN